MTVNDRSVAIRYLSRMVHDDHLGFEPFSVQARVIVGIGTHVPTMDVTGSHSLDTEPHVVARQTLCKRQVVHLDALAFCQNSNGPKLNLHPWRQHSSFNSSTSNGSYSLDFVAVLDWNSERHIC